jgi:hypothetical protein
MLALMLRTGLDAKKGVLSVRRVIRLGRGRVTLVLQETSDGDGEVCCLRLWVVVRELEVVWTAVEDLECKSSILQRMTEYR